MPMLKTGYYGKKFWILYMVNWIPDSVENHFNTKKNALPSDNI